MSKILILGSSGLVGSCVLQKVLADPFFEQVTVWVRKDLGLHHPKLRVQVVDFESLPPTDATVVFACLGTTQKKTPNSEAYRRLEVDIPVEVAKSGLAQGLDQFHYISSIGSNDKANTAYLRNKRDAEKALAALGIPALYLYRPSLLHGRRSEARPLEDTSNVLLKVLDPLLLGPLKKYRRISADTVAEAMVRNARRPAMGTSILESDAIQRLVNATSSSL